MAPNPHGFRDVTPIRDVPRFVTPIRRFNWLMGVGQPMNPPPIALGLVRCQKFIVEEQTRNATNVRTLTKPEPLA
jgi:hypothetical protein